MATCDYIAMLPIVPWSVCLLVSTVSCAKTDELIEVPFGVWTRVGPINHVLDGVADRPREKEFWSGRFPATARLWS